MPKPKKIRELLQDLKAVGFNEIQGGKGSHRKLVHPRYRGAVTLIGNSAIGVAWNSPKFSREDKATALQIIKEHLAVRPRAYRRAAEPVNRGRGTITMEGGMR